MAEEDVKKLVQKMKDEIAEATKHTIGKDLSREQEAEFVALALEGLAWHIRNDMIHGFDWSWKQGTGNIGGTNYIMPKHPINFISFKIDIPGMQDEDEEGKNDD